MCYGLCGMLLLFMMCRCVALSGLVQCLTFIFLVGDVFICVYIELSPVKNC
ncbi:hypothetical protein KC19_12G148500 [Ceratodon purpureus]|uniref:NADH dehydrogenase subunit 4L n=1 Tax=Ceratodon purpureus TaxID=3225 RepID=A0A8T0GB02_CERPU|nr:hypothetical protein KC19_12G148500 [Ceratodon purpureus]